MTGNNSWRKLKEEKKKKTQVVHLLFPTKSCPLNCHLNSIYSMKHTITLKSTIYTNSPFQEEPAVWGFKYFVIKFITHCSTKYNSSFLKCQLKHCLTWLIIMEQMFIAQCSGCRITTQSAFRLVCYEPRLLLSLYNCVCQRATLLGKWRLDCATKTGRG